MSTKRVPAMASTHCFQPRGAGAVDPVQVLDQRDGVLGAVLHELTQHAEELALLQIGVDVRHRTLRVGHAEELEQDRQNLAVAVVEQEQVSGELLARAAVRVLLGDAVVVAEDLQDRQERNVLAVRRAASLDDAHAGGAAVLGELVAQPALARPRLGHDADHLSVAGAGARQRRLQDVHLGVAADEARQTAGPCDLEARAQRRSRPRARRRGPARWRP